VNKIVVISLKQRSTNLIFFSLPLFLSRINVSQRKVGDNPNIRTVMTFNKGGSWNLLNAPATDSRGQNTDCFATAGCSLHIHGTSDYWGPFYSLDSAIGLAMATGNLGDRLVSITKLIM
jgi:hypothetical protein